jgi:predicted transcriptional regulator
MGNNTYHAPEPSLVPSDDEKPHDLSDEEWAAIKEAWADVEAGRVYSHEEIVAWLRTWGTADEREDTD